MVLRAIDKSTTVDRAVATLTQALFEGALLPGTALRETALAESLDVARSTVREALQVLVSKGLVSRSPNKGAFVRQLRAAEVEDIFRARTILECEAARAVASCPPETLHGLETAFINYEGAAAEGNLFFAAEAHIGFHAALVGLIGSERLVLTEWSMMQDLQLAIASIDKSSNDLPNEVEKHRRLSDLLRARDVEGALSTIEADLEHSKKFILGCTVERTG